jgi:DnaJ-domain-containing protein 1
VAVVVLAQQVACKEIMNNILKIICRLLTYLAILHVMIFLLLSKDDIPLGIITSFLMILLLLVIVFYISNKSKIYIRRQIFLRAAFGIFAKLAMVDGQLTKLEVQVVERIADQNLKLNEKERAEMIKLFNETIATEPEDFNRLYPRNQAPKSISEHLRCFTKTFDIYGADKGMCVLFLRLIFMLASADKILHPQEEFILKNVAVILGILPSHYNMLFNEYFVRQTTDSFGEKMNQGYGYTGFSSREEFKKTDFNQRSWEAEQNQQHEWMNEDWFKSKWGSASSQWKSSRRRGQQQFDQQANSQDWFKKQSQWQTENKRYYQTDPLKKYYDLLGCPVGCSEAELKKVYRKQALENHPDRLLSRGLPKQTMKLANDRFLAIKHAYEEICNKRGIK